MLSIGKISSNNQKQFLWFDFTFMETAAYRLLKQLTLIVFIIMHIFVNLCFNNVGILFLLNVKRLLLMSYNTL
jgi:hypothetical protein